MILKPQKPRRTVTRSLFADFRNVFRIYSCIAVDEIFFGDEDVFDEDFVETVGYGQWKSNAHAYKQILIGWFLRAKMSDGQTLTCIWLQKWFFGGNKIGKMDNFGLPRIPYGQLAQFWLQQISSISPKIAEILSKMSTISSILAWRWGKNSKNWARLL